MEKKFSKVMLCLHCGNETIFEILSVYNDNVTEFEYDHYYGENIPTITFYTTYTLNKCPVYSKVTLKTVESCDADCDFSGKPIEYENNLYPSIAHGETQFLPDKIKRAFESAIKTKNVDAMMCALGQRRTLEMFCKEQNAEGRDLNSKIKYLVNNGVIPRGLDTASHLIRDIGKAAAHADDVEFDKVTID